MPGWPAAPGCSPSRRSRPTRWSISTQLGWPALTATPAGLEIAATCRIVELHDFKGPPEWRAVPLFDQCIDAFLMSFKIWNAATVGGNVCMSLPAGAMISLTAALEGVCTLWPRERQAAPGAGRRFRHRQSHQRAAAGRAVCGRSILPASALVEALRHAPGVAHPSRPLGRADRRHRRRQGRGLPADHHRGDAATGASALREDSVCGRAARRRSTSACRRTPGSTTSTARRPTSATSPSTSPSRFARSWHEQLRSQWPSLLRPSRSPASACAPSCATSRCSASRKAATPATAAPARSGSTASRSIPAWCPPSAARAARSRPSRASPRTASCIRCRRRSTTRRPSSAASAPPA